MKEYIEKRIKVSVFSLERGLEVYDNVKLVRIKSEQYNMLIMQDHTPAIGEVRGNISFLLDHDEIMLENVEGYFSLIQNDFHFLEKGTFISKQEINENMQEE